MSNSSKQALRVKIAQDWWRAGRSVPLPRDCLADKKKNRRDVTSIIIHVTDRDGAAKTIVATAGQSLMVNLVVNGGLNIAAICGGCCSCATCHVYLDSPLREISGEPSSQELELLASSVHCKAGRSRLACQIIVEDGLNSMVAALAPED